MSRSPWWLSSTWIVPLSQAIPFSRWRWRRRKSPHAGWLPWTGPASSTGVPLMRNGDVVKRPADPAELTKLYTDEAIQFIEKNKEGPFFLYLPLTAPHKPTQPEERFRGKTKLGATRSTATSTRGPH